MSPEELSVGGKAPKWILKRECDQGDFYIAKLGSKNGDVEVLTELFNNQLGARLGFEMAHSGIARLDQHLYFVTRNFRKSGEHLVHGSQMIEEFFVATGETQLVTSREEQKFYSVDFLVDVIVEFCGSAAPEVLQKFIAMLVFDALIGSMDRHAQNWGVLASTTIPVRFRFAPIFDSARALMWDQPSGRLEAFLTGELSIEKYVRRSKPCIGPPNGHPRIGKCSHFDLVRSLVREYPEKAVPPLKMVLPRVGLVARELLDEFPFCRLPLARRRAILKILQLRADCLDQIYREEEAK